MDSRKLDSLDSFGIIALVGVQLLLGINHVVIKVVNSGIQPIFFCGLRSIIAVFFIISWMIYRKIPISFTLESARLGILAGLIFAAEFLCLFLALDYTTVIRNSIIYYSMPVWLTIMAHFFLPNEYITKVKILGLTLAFLGVIWAILSRDQVDGDASLLGDFFALAGAILWAGIIIMARGTKFSEISPEMQLLWMVLISGPILIIISPFFGDLVRDFEYIHLVGLGFQAIVVVTGGFIFWLWLLSIYPASGVASFAFLTPIFGIAGGWFLLGEEVKVSILGAASLVVIGIYLINRPAKI